ncbi:hypothetical protein DDB_G0276727 [Dictyostelium discoideum AX4]|uniref:Uncharacterized protein n=1 Tax=Dictyostelium discoideum TaxID=44689 RepID=Q550X8_DICDI|nr:hypothetical protein DDB_G0276727 [Dictyostelium discoideum AX4]EAL69067.1 hypothetical protein DDB_G0276727 [Dictyostelium discoideum AX4]|eukprot:XP_643006.1 hypothetical protein DDB_G0276727 [Dictyostelium discoideum AX4]
MVHSKNNKLNNQLSATEIEKNNNNKLKKLLKKYEEDVNFTNRL